MAITLRIELDGAAAARRLAAISGAALSGALRAGLATAMQTFIGATQMQAVDDGIESRTGSLLNSLRGELDESDEPRGRVGVPEESPAAKYAWLLTRASFRIEPVRAKFLAIPTGPNLTGAGVPLFASPRQLPGKVYFRRDVAAPIPWGRGGVWTGLTAGLGAGAAYEAYFLLLRGVNARGRDVYEKALAAAEEDMVADVQESVDALLSDR